MTAGGFYPVWALNPATGEVFDTSVVTSEPGGMTNDMTDPNNRVLLAHLTEAGVLERSKGRSDDEFGVSPGLFLLSTVDRLLRARDIAVRLEQELAEATRLLNGVLVRAACDGTNMNTPEWQELLEFLVREEL